MSLTSDPNDPRLTHGVDAEPTPQADVYLVLSEEERARGFVRPLRRSYRHVGPPGPEFPLRDLTSEELARYRGGDVDYRHVKYEPYPQDGEHVLGRFWTRAQLDAVGRGCGATTAMNSTELCETYARRPSFYGSTYCVSCRKHLPVAEFVWTEDGRRVGS